MTDRQVGLAGVVVVFYALVYGALLALAPPTAGQLANADPLVQLAAAWVGIPSIAPLSALPALAWLAFSRPGREDVRRAAIVGLLALAAIVVLLPALRLVAGPVLPSFIPPEESARPGMALGIGAALLEEGLFRLGLLALLYRGLSRRLPAGKGALIASVLLASLAVAAAHEIGPGAVAFDAGHFAARFIVLGVVMSLVFLRVGPVFLVTAHCTAHVGIPLLFPGAT